MSNRWVISWLVIDYGRWSMSNQWLIEAQTFCGLSITHRWHRLLIDVIDYLLMLLITHRWPIDYSSTIILRTKDTFLAFLYHFFHWWFFISVRRIFLYNWRSCWWNSTFTKGHITFKNVETWSANHKYILFLIVQYFTLPNSLINNKTCITEQ